MESQREVNVRWGDGGNGYPVSLRVITETGVPGLLNKLTKVFSDMKLNIDAAMCSEAPEGKAENIFRFHAKDLDELNVVVRKLEGLKGVFAVNRMRD